MTWSGNLMRAALVIGLAACAGPKVDTRFDPGADFTAFTTFAFEELETAGFASPMADPRLRAKIEDALVRGLTRGGLRQVPRDAPPDLVVHYWVAVSRPPERTSGSTAGASDSYRGAGGRSTNRARTGALVVQLTRATTGAMVWRADMTGRLSEDPETNLELVEEVVEEALSNYPPVRMR